MRRFFLPALCALLGGLCCTGCASITVSAAKPVIQNAVVCFESEPDPELAKQAVASQIKLLDALIHTSPSDDQLKTDSAKAFFAYAFLFVEDQDVQRAKTLYKRGLAQALSALGWDEQTISGPSEQLISVLEKTSRSKLKPLFWAGANWSGFINLSLDDPEALSQIANLKILLDKIISIDPGYYYATPYVLAATIEASQPRMLGGNHKKAQEYFGLASKENNHKLLLGDYFQAKTLAVAKQDKQSFLQLLENIQNTPADILPPQQLVNTVIKQKAKDLEKQAEDLFFE